MRSPTATLEPAAKFLSERSERTRRAGKFVEGAQRSCRRRPAGHDGDTRREKGRRPFGAAPAQPVPLVLSHWAAGLTGKAGAEFAIGVSAALPVARRLAG